MRIILNIALVAAILGLILALDVMIFDQRHYLTLITKKECEYSVPKGYKIVYSTTKKMYAVCVLCSGDYYLYEGSCGTIPMYSSIAMPAMFYDSCAAKGYLKKYIESITPKCVDFK